MTFLHLPCSSVWKTAAILLGLFSWATQPLWGQQVIRMGQPLRAISPARTATGDVVVQAPSSANPPQIAGQPVAVVAAQPEEALSPQDQLLQKLLETQFDRTPAAVLRAWSERATEPPESADDEMAESRTTAMVASSHRGFTLFDLQQTGEWKPGDRIEVRREGGRSMIYEVLSLKEKTLSAQRVTTSIETTDGQPSGSGSPSEESGEPREKEPTSDSAAEDQQAMNRDQADSGGESDEAEPAEKDSDAKAAADQPASENADSVDKLKSGETVTLKFVPAKGDQQTAATVEQQVAEFNRQVTLGEWDRVKLFLGELPKDHADQVYQHLLTSLASPPAAGNRSSRPGMQPPQQTITPDDVLAIAAAAPSPFRLPSEEAGASGQVASGELPGAQNVLPPGVQLPAGLTIDDLPPATLEALWQRAGGRPAAAVSGASSTSITALASLIRSSREAGYDFTTFVQQLRDSGGDFGGEDSWARLRAADLLMQAQLVDAVESFLPEWGTDGLETNVPALRIWSQLALAQYRRRKVGLWLERAWQINQWLVAEDSTPAAEKQAALNRLVQLAPQVDEQLGAAWLRESFAEYPDRGMKILANLGGRSSELAANPVQNAPEQRVKLLRLQNEAVIRLLEVAPDRANRWQSALTLLLQNWLNEAGTTLQYSKERARQAMMQIDMYGNYYWIDQDELMRRFGRVDREPQPVRVGDLLEMAPSEPWLRHIDPNLVAEANRRRANLHLKVNEEEEAFPFIEQLAPQHPEMARDLVHEFLRIWTNNHDPNTDRQRQNPFVYSFGFNQKAEAIPLTRSKQERNLRDLTRWVKRIRQLPIDDIDESRLAQAFTTCHSSAEVFELDRVRAVFGELTSLQPETIASLCQSMRSNLASSWRDIRNQEAQQTNRREPEVQQEVLRGYRVARKLAAEALQTAPENWQLHLATACLMHDENEYGQTVQKSSEFSQRRDAAFDQFAVAADKYAAVTPQLELTEQSTDVYDYWFYAALGACELGQIEAASVPDRRQYARIRNAIDALPGELATSHLGNFANNLFTRMSPLKPEIKFRYLRGGFEIVGDHPRAWEARRLYDYYQDLVYEIRLKAEIDGPDVVGHGEPFGVYLNILHTPEIERESGGFGKYVQNQNSLAYAYNYGRPTEDYRDKFTDAAHQALDEQFEVLNITFEAPDTMKSRAADKEGWRVTPYAYLLLKPRGPEVDRIASIKLDLDFLDTSGYVVIPIESPAVVIDASSERVDRELPTDMALVQTLDERQAEEGKLSVEVSATASGLVPPIDQLLDLERKGFELVEVDDQGVLPTRFDPDSQAIQILSDRSWTLEYAVTDPESPRPQFSFAEPRLETLQVSYQRYDDADLVESGPVVQLERTYQLGGGRWLWWGLPVALIGLATIIAIPLLRQRPEPPAPRFRVPEEVNAFTVLTLLNEIYSHNGIRPEEAEELEASIRSIEDQYFGRVEAADRPDLESLARRWVQRAH